MLQSANVAPLKRKRTWKRMAKKDRRNLKMWAEGARESILKPHIPAYTDALERGWRSERDYVQGVCNEFHSRISWRLLDGEEPDLPLPDYDRFAKPVPEELDEDEKEIKRQRIETMNARIGRWLKYRARRLQQPKRMDRTRDPFSILMAKLAGYSAPPKARQAFQQYMHESYDKEIAPVVNARWVASCVEDDGATLRKKGPDAPFRARIARELFGELSAEEQDALRGRAQAEAQKAKAQYVDALKNPPSKRPADRQRCIDNLGTFMSAILKGVAEYTGLHAIAIFGGPIPQFGGEIRTVMVSHGRNHGPSPCHWAHWAKARFNRDVLDFMREYLATAYTPQECQEAALPDDDTASASLAQAKYTMSPEGDDNSDVDADSDTSSDNSSSDSDLDTELEQDLEAHKSKKKKGKEKKGKGREAIEKGKGKAKGTMKENVDKSGKRKRAEQKEREGPLAKKKRVHSSKEVVASDEDDDADEPNQAEEMSFEKRRAQNIAANKALLAEADRQFFLKHPKYAREREERLAVAEKRRVRSKPKTKPKAQAGPVRRSGRLTGVETGGDVEMQGRSEPEDGFESQMEVTTAIFATPTPSSSTPPPQTSRAAASLSQPPSTPSTAPPDPAPPVSTAAPPPRPPTAPPDPPPSTTAPPPPPSAVPPPPPQPLPAAAMSTASRASSSVGSSTPSGELSPFDGPPTNPHDSEETGPTSHEGSVGMGEDRACVRPGLDVVDGVQWDGTVASCPEGAAQWFSEVYPEVSMHNLGENYNTLLAVWGKLERAYGYKKSAGIANWNVKAANRPLALQNWVKAGRGRKSSGNGAGPSIGALAAFEAAWWQWWAGVQPDWRVKDAGRLQRFLRTTYPAPTAEAWAAMRHPGPNGALSFVATLYWWGKEVANNGGREERESWTEAVCDVKWMLNGLLATEVEGKS